jgi:hypothetical protein
MRQVLARHCNSREWEKQTPARRTCSSSQLNVLAALLRRPRGVVGVRNYRCKSFKEARAGHRHRCLAADRVSFGRLPTSCRRHSGHRRLSSRQSD